MSKIERENKELTIFTKTYEGLKVDGKDMGPLVVSLVIEPNGAATLISGGKPLMMGPVLLVDKQLEIVNAFFYEALREFDSSLLEKTKNEKGHPK